MTTYHPTGLTGSYQRAFVESIFHSLRYDIRKVRLEIENQLPTLMAGYWHSEHYIFSHFIFQVGNKISDDFSSSWESQQIQRYNRVKNNLRECSKNKTKDWSLVQNAALAIDIKMLKLG